MHSQGPIFVEGTRFAALRGALERPAERILPGIGAMLVAETQKAFREERFGVVRWKSRGDTGMNPNWPGILSDFARGKTPPERRFQDRPVLRDNNLLARSFAWRVIGQNTVEEGTMLGYADVLHTGGESKATTITKAIQTRLWEWMKKLGGAEKRAEAAPQKREDREARGAVKDDPQIAGLKAALTASKRAYQGQKVPPGERQRRQQIQMQITARKRVVDAAARGKIEPMTGAEAGKVASARAKNERAKKLGWLLNPKLVGVARTIKHPTRPMVGLPPQLVKDIEGLYGLTVRRVS